MTSEVGLFEAKTRLSELVELITTGGDDFVITRRGKPVARLLPILEADSGVERALALILAARHASVAAEGTLRDLIDDGRVR